MRVEAHCAKVILGGLDEPEWAAFTAVWRLATMFRWCGLLPALLNYLAIGTMPTTQTAQAIES
jgi:hypothetical protein